MEIISLCIPWNKGKINLCSKETLKLMSESQKGRIAWNKGLKNKQVVWNKGMTKQQMIEYKDRII